MGGSIERLRQHIRARSLAPMMLLVLGIPGPSDPITKRIGTAGVITMPAVPASHGDSLSDARRDSRAERGRVLYAPGHAPRDLLRDTTAASARPLRKQACVDQQAVRGRGRNSAPTS
jgi:hypothetical protein